MLRFTPPFFSQWRIPKGMRQSAFVEAAFARWCSCLCLTDDFMTDVCEIVISWNLEPLGNTHSEAQTDDTLIWAAFGHFREHQQTNRRSLASLSLSWSLFHRSHQTFILFLLLFNFLNFFLVLLSLPLCSRFFSLPLLLAREPVGKRRTGENWCNEFRALMLAEASLPWLLVAINLPHSVRAKCAHNRHRGSSNWLPITRLWIKDVESRGRAQYGSAVTFILTLRAA